MAEAREKEPEVVLIGDTHIQRLAQHEVCEHIHYTVLPEVVTSQHLQRTLLGCHALCYSSTWQPSICLQN